MDVFLVTDTAGDGIVDFASPYYEPVDQRKTTTTSGNMKEWVVSFGGNYKDRFYLGGTIGLPTLRYKEESIYREFDNEEDGYNVLDFESLSVNDELKVSGSGLNLKLGMIYRVTDFARIGMSVHTPTTYLINETYNTKMTVEYAEDEVGSGEYVGTESSSSPISEFNYEISTPMRASASAGFIIGKFAALNLDYEFVDYSSGRVRSGGYDFTDENDQVREKYRANHNIRVGTEINLRPIALRAGYGIQGTPYHIGVNDGGVTTMSLGIGFKDEDYFFDIAYVYSQMSKDYYLYSSKYVNPATNTMTTGQIMFTLGFRY